MTFNEKIKTTNNNIKQNKAQYNSDSRTPKVFASLSGMLVNTNFDKWRTFTREKTIKKNCYSQKIWILTVKHWVEKANWHFKQTIKMIRQGVLIW